MVHLARPAVRPHGRRSTCRDALGSGFLLATLRGFGKTGSNFSKPSGWRPRWSLNNFGNGHGLTGTPRLVIPRCLKPSESSGKVVAPWLCHHSLSHSKLRCTPGPFTSTLKCPGSPPQRRRRFTIGPAIRLVRATCVGRTRRRSVMGSCAEPTGNAVALLQLHVNAAQIIFAGSPGGKSWGNPGKRSRK